MSNIFRKLIFPFLLVLWSAVPALPGDVEHRLDALERELTEKPGDFRVYWENGLRFDSKDRRFKYRLGGRIQNDWAFFDADPEIEDAFGSQKDGVEFRRAQIYLSGLLYNRVQFKAQYDFAGGTAKFKDVFIGLLDVPVVGNILVGHFIEPFLLETHVSNKYLTFLERSLLFEAFAPDRNPGIAIYDQELDGRLFWAAGWFKEAASDPPVARESGNNAVTVRLAGLPWFERKGRHLLHLGASYSYRDPPGGTARFRTRPEAHLTESRFVDTGPLMADSVQLANAEAAWVAGPLSLQAEYTRAWVAGGVKGEAGFDGFYAQAGWFLTGEHRPYLGGAFSRVIPRKNFLEGGGLGAWQVVARYSQVDLDDAEAGVKGGFEENITLGLNGFLNPQTRLMFNYTHASPSTASGDLDVLQMRFQVEF